ncbi:MAG TPA: VWA domain-containing protein [Desulfobulbaceae bacterium]|nr:VWA domain-containing protein [Desulfobulbaceae bacterium]
MMMTIHFARPFWLIAGGLVCCAVLVLLWINTGRQQKRLTRFASEKMWRQLTANVSKTRRRLKIILVFGAVLACFAALARPQYGERWIDVKQKGIDILIGLDVSRSMLAPDVRPNRLARAKLAIKDFVDRLDGDRVGLLPFAGTSFLMCPLTTDYNAFNESLDAVTPASIPVGGTNIGEVIRKAETILHNESNYKILILVTDGENLQGKALAAAKEAAKQKMTIYTVGVGTKAGELIPDAMNNGGFIKDENGNFIRSRLDEKTLTKIAELTGGIYVPLGSMGQGFTTIYQEKLKLVPKEEHQERKQRQPIERFYWPLALALLLLTIEFLVSGRKASGFMGLPFIKTAGRRIFNHGKLLIVFSVLLFRPPLANGSTADQFFHAGKLDQAEKKYTAELKRQPHNPVVQFNLGDVQYRKKNFAQAKNSFTGALATDDLDLQAKAYYNLGNTEYQLGRTTLKTDPEQTIEHYRQAVKAFEGCLKLRSGDKDAEENLITVKKELEKLKKQQEKKKKKKKDQKEKSPKKNKNNTSKKQKKSQNSDLNKQQKQNNSQQSGTDKGGQQKKDRNGQDKKNEKTKQSPDNDRQKETNKRKNGAGSSPKEQQKNKNGTDTDKKKSKDHDSSRVRSRQAGSAAQQMSKADAKRRKQGKMTRAEAANLLDALKSEEGRLEFIPNNPGKGGQPVQKDW